MFKVYRIYLFLSSYRNVVTKNIWNNFPICLAILNQRGVMVMKNTFYNKVESACTKATLIYILNAFDIIFTFILLKTGEFTEVNLLMKPVVGSPMLSIIIKILLPALLIYYLIQNLHKLSLKNIYFCHLCINMVLIVYVYTNVMHICYFFITFSNM